MAVGKGSILRASNANAAVKEKKTTKETASIKEKSQPQEVVKELAAKVTDITAKVSDMAAMVPVDALRNVPKTWGTPVINEGKLASLTESIKTFGMIVPIIVYKNKKQELLVLKGSHRVVAAKAAGLLQVPVSFVEANTDAKAKEIYVELRSFEKADETEKEYEVVSSITVNMPSYLL